MPAANALQSATRHRTDISNSRQHAPFILASHLCCARNKTRPGPLDDIALHRQVKIYEKNVPVPVSLAKWIAASP